MKNHYTVVNDTVEIYITQRDGTKHIVYVSVTKLPKLLGYRVGVCTADKKFRAYISLSNGTIYLHRFLLDAPKGLEVDHEDSNPLNNRDCNLRLATSLQNKQNGGAQSNSKTGIRGVCWEPYTGKWKTQVTVNGKHHTLGRFTDLADAELAVSVFRAENMPYSLDARL